MYSQFWKATWFRISAFASFEIIAERIKFRMFDLQRQQRHDSYKRKKIALLKKTCATKRTVKLFNIFFQLGFKFWNELDRLCFASSQVLSKVPKKTRIHKSTTSQFIVWFGSNCLFFSSQRVKCCKSSKLNLSSFPMMIFRYFLSPYCLGPDHLEGRYYTHLEFTNAKTTNS